MVKRPRAAKQRLGWNRYKVPGVNYKGTGRSTIMVRPLRRQQGLCTVTYLSTQPPAHPPTHSPTNPTTKPISTPITHRPTHPPTCACYLVYCTCSYNAIHTWYLVQQYRRNYTVEITKYQYSYTIVVVYTTYQSSTLLTLPAVLVVAVVFDRSPSAGERSPPKSPVYGDGLPAF